MFELAAIILYFSVVLTIGILSSYSQRMNAAGFIIGNRSLNYWLTALAAHASDMSNWLFMAYPAMIFTVGLNKTSIALGLLICMYLNWQFIAPKIRVATEKLNSLTFFSYLGSRFGDESGALRIVTTLICFVFYTIYISAGLVGLGLLIESLFHIPYSLGILIGILVALPYVIVGGYLTLAWIDLFQGFFLMAIIIFVPSFLIGKVGGWEGIKEFAHAGHISLRILPELSFKSLSATLLTMLGWGLGYFGQPAIITKFMGIKHTSEMSKSKLLGMSWMSISLAAATMVGLVGIPFFQGKLDNPEMVFIELVKQSFHPFFIGLILCAVFAASINVMCSQILVVCSSLAEDIYKRAFRNQASSKEELLVSRLGVLLVALIAFLIAFYKISSIYSLVLYAWSGLGAAFGPLLIFSLYSKKSNKSIAWAGILSGSIVSAIWPWINSLLSFDLDPIIAGFTLSFLSIWITARIQKRKLSI